MVPFEKGKQYKTLDGDTIEVVSRKLNTIRFRDAKGIVHSAKVEGHFDHERNRRWRLSSKLEA